MAPTKVVSGFEEPQSVSDGERLRLIEECVTDYAIFTFDNEGRITSWNVGAQRILGYTTSEALGQSGAIIFTPEDRQQGAPGQEMGQARTEGRAEDERWHLRKDGCRFWASGILHALRDEAGTLRGYIKILRDRTATHEAEVHREAAEALRLQHERQITLMRERSRMAHELHDTLAGGLTAIVLQLMVAEDLLDTAPQEARPRILRACDIARESLAETRRTVQALRPHALQGADLPSALFQLAEQTTADSGIPVQCERHGTPVFLLPEVESHLYRIAQEALTNALKYAQASQITLYLIFAPGQVQLHIHDDGVGFDPQAPAQGGGFGITSMRERAREIGGECHLTCTPGQGTRIEVSVPLA